MDVSAADQQSICKFSAMMVEDAEITKRIQSLTKTIENLDDAMKDLELVLDEDEPIRYRCGSGFMNVQFDSVQGKLETELRERRAEMAKLVAEQSTLAGEMEGLRRSLYARFGDAIRLEI